MNKQELQAALDEVQARFHVPSYSATIYHKGELFTITNGFCDIDAKQEPDGNTLYAIGSCTKSFVAGAICVLVDQGLLRLDDTVKTYLPEFEMYDPYVSQHLTVRDMLCHRCGLPRHELSWYARLDTLTEADIIRQLKYLRPNQPFRYVWQYSNQMFALAGFLIRRITGKSWKEVVREHIWRPMGITRAAFSPEEAMAMGNCAQPYLYDRETGTTYTVPHADIGAMSSSGCIYMSTEELSKWDQMLLHSGVYRGVRILSEEMAAAMTTPQMIRPGKDDPKPVQDVAVNHGYGLGLMTEVFRGHRVVHHGGHIDGFMADQSFLPDDDFACSILTNMGVIRGALVMRYVTHEMLLGGNRNWSEELDKFYADQTAQAESDKNTLWEERPANAPCPVSTAAIAGRYQEPAYGTILVEAVTDSEILVHMGTAELKGKHYANQYFYMEEPYILPGIEIEARVDIDPKANVTGFSARLDPDGTELIHFTRVPEGDCT